MKKLLINFGFLVLVAVIGLTCMGNASAAPGGLSQLISWFKSPPAQEKIVEPASASAQVNPEIKLADMTSIPDNLPTASKPDFPSENLATPPSPKKPEWDTQNASLPPALAEVSYSHQISLAKFIHNRTSDSSKLIFTLDAKHPRWLQISADGQNLEGNQQQVNEPGNEVEIGISVMDKLTGQSGGRQIFKMAVEHQELQPKWSVSSFPSVAIQQKNYEDINLNDYVSSRVPNDSFLYSLTPGKTNPEWVSLQPNGQLHISADKISLEDINTTQIIYLTVTSTHSAKSSNAEITIQINPNLQLPAPEWRSSFSFKDGIVLRPYFANLADAINTDRLPDNDQLTFQIINSSANWLEIGENGFSLTAKNIPEGAADKYYEAILRVTSKMSGKSNDFNGRLYINPVPQSFLWQNLPGVTLNKSYSLNLNDYVKSNIRNDQITFEIDLTTLPNWLSVQNHQNLTGIPQEASLISEPQKISVTATSKVTGVISKAVLIIPVNADPQLMPQWKNDIFSNPVIDEPFRSDDLTTVLENRYPQDQLSFEYISGPEWMGFNGLCHCLASKGDVPSDAAGKKFTIDLRVHSKASGKAVDYTQTVMVYTGVPHWMKTQLPDVKIAQGEPLEIPINNYAQNDISGDLFTYQLDNFHSPRWISLKVTGKGQKDEQTYLVINTHQISPNEVGTVQSVRVLATSQSTHKTSVQLLTINVLANGDLPKPEWINAPLVTATAGATHVMDLNQYIKNSVLNDRLTVSIGEGSPHWLSIQNNRLTISAPHEQVGGPYSIPLVVHSQASNTNTEINLNIAVQLKVVSGDNMEIHSFYDNHQSIVIRGLQKNHKYHLAEVKGSHFDYGPFYSPRAIKTDEDWNGNPFYTVGDDKIIETGDDGIVSIVYYSVPSSPAPQFEQLTIR